MTEAKRDFYELYDRVAAGEEVIITRWGRPVARMILNPDYRPPSDASDNAGINPCLDDSPPDSGA